MKSYDIDSQMYILGCALNNYNGDYAIGALERFLNAEDEFSKLAGIPTEYLVDNLKENLTSGQFMSVVLSNEGIRQRCIEWVEKWQKPKKVKAVDISIPEEIWVALETNGLIQREPLKWLGSSKALLAYFVDTANDELNLKHGLRRTIKPFEIMFQEEKLRGAMSEYKNKTGSLPLGYEKIDRLWKDYKK